MKSNPSKALELATTVWNRCYKLAEQKDQALNCGYIVGLIKRSLGIKTEQMFGSGFPEDIIVEAILVESFEENYTPESELALLVISNCFHPDGRVRLNQQGKLIIPESFKQEMVAVLSEKFTIEQLRKLFPSISSEYLKVLLGECYSAEELRGLFPGADLKYLEFLM